MSEKRPHRWRPMGSRTDRGYGTAHVRIRRAMMRIARKRARANLKAADA